MAKGLRVSIEGERGTISLDTFVTVVRNTFDILADLDSAISSLPQGSLAWFVTDVSFGSLFITIEPKSKIPDVDYSPRVTEAFVDGLAHIQREQTTPPFFSDYGLRKTQNLAKALRRDGAKEVVIQDIERQTTALIKPEVAADISRLIKIQYQEVGSVEGKLEMVSVHGIPRFTVYHAITQRSIRCKFDPRKLLDLVKEALGRRVVVSGLVYYNFKQGPVLFLSLFGLDISPAYRPR